MTPNEKANEYLELYGAKASLMVKKEISKREGFLGAQMYWRDVHWYVEEQLANCGAKKRG